MAKYEERYVAFVDILGFRNLIQSIRSDEAQASKVQQLLRIVHDRPDPEMNELKESADFRAQSISDAVALSSALRPEGLDHLFYTVSELATQLLPSGIFIRGAITQGMLYHDEKTVFGDGLVRAYDIESKIARFPRVIITRDVCLRVERYRMLAPWKPRFASTLLQADDGPMYLNVLAELAMWVRSTDQSHISVDQAKKMRRAIQVAFNTSIDDPKIFEKVQWFAAYWNNTISSDHPGLEKIVGPGVAEPAFQA